MRLLLTAFIIFLSASSCASVGIDCNNPINILQTRICAENSFESENRKLEALVNRININLISFSGKDYADSFISLQRQWVRFVEAQCTHQRGIYGKGSLAGISYITCKEKLYTLRENSLKLLYEVVLIDK